MHFPAISKNAPTVCEEAPTVSTKSSTRQLHVKKLNCKLEASNCKQKTHPIFGFSGFLEPLAHNFKNIKKAVAVSEEKIEERSCV